MLHLFSSRLIAAVLLLSLVAVPCIDRIVRLQGRSLPPAWKRCLLCSLLPLICCGWILCGELSDRAAALLVYKTGYNFAILLQNLSLFIWRASVFCLPLFWALHAIAQISHPWRLFCFLSPGLFWPCLALLLLEVCPNAILSCPQALVLTPALPILGRFWINPDARQRAIQSLNDLYKQCFASAQTPVVPQLQLVERLQPAPKPAPQPAPQSALKPMQKRAPQVLPVPQKPTLIALPPQAPALPPIHSQVTRCARPQCTPLDETILDETIECAMDFDEAPSVHRDHRRSLR